MNKKGLKDIQVKNKKVLVRCDFNVPLDSDGNILDDTRIQSAIPTIKYLLDNEAIVILMSHIGRPKGKPLIEFSLKLIVKRLEELIGKNVVFADFDDVINEKVMNMSRRLLAGEIMLLQNTRYRKEETKNEPVFSKELASLADIYVNDAFGTSHRSHASNVGVCEYLPSSLGFLVEKEIKIMGDVFKNPKKPLTAILGGAKVSDKIGVIQNFIGIVDNIIIGGGMTYTFLKAKGYNIGKSLVEEDKISMAQEIIKNAKEKKVNLILPVDTVVAKEFKNDTDFMNVNIDSIPNDYMGLDIGEKSIELFCETLNKSKTIIWNGPLGVFEMDNFAKGTNSIAKAIADNDDAITIIGGGDSASAIKKIGLEEKINHISTGGGASLEFFEGKILPGIDAIDDK